MSFQQAAALTSSTASRKGNTNFKHLEVSMATRLGETSRRPLDRFDPNEPSTDALPLFPISISRQPQKNAIDQNGVLA
jgi:hypothetical protein